MRLILGILLLSFLGFSAYAQKICGTDISTPIPSESLSNPQLRNEQIKVTVVFHIVLPEEHEGISKAQIWSQLDALNRDFNRSNRDISYSDGYFASEIGNGKIQFCLAKEDPNGQPSSGFTFKTTSVENIGQKVFQDGRRQVHYDVLGGTDPWDPNKYLNVWVAEMETFSGRSSFPAEGPMQEDGIVIDPDFFGSFGNLSNNFNKGRTLVHEAGHYLGLLHPWVEDGCEKDDGIDDTPLQNGPYFNCPVGNKPESCNSRDMIQNFMQYGPDDCLLFFTKGQVAHMHSVLTNYRSGLLEHAQNGSCGIAIDISQPKVYYDPELKAVRLLAVSPEQAIEVKVVDISGKLLIFQSINGFHIPTIDLHHFPNGVYIVTIQTNGQTYTKKILKYD